MKGLIFTYLLAYGGALLALFRPFVGVTAYIALFIMRPESLWPWAVPRGQYSLIVIAAACVGWLFQGLGDWNLGRGTAIIAALVGHFFWGILSAQHAADPSVSWGWVNSVFKIVLPVVIGVSTMKSIRDLRLVCWAIVGAYGYISLEFNVYYFRGILRVADGSPFGGIDEVSMCVGMVAAIGMSIFLAMHYDKLWIRCIPLICCLFMTHFILFSMTRGGMLGLVVVGLVALPLWPRRPMDIAMLLAAFLVAGYLASGSVLNEFSTTFADSNERDASAQSRIDLWRGCIDLMKRHPILGVGPDHFPVYSENYGYRRRESHTLWLNYGAELGIPGLAMIVAFYGLNIVRLWVVVRDRSPHVDPWLRSAAKMVITGLCGFIVAAQFVALDLMETSYYVGMVGAGTLALYSRAKAAESQELHLRNRLDEEDTLELVPTASS